MASQRHVLARPYRIYLGLSHTELVSWNMLECLEALSECLIIDEPKIRLTKTLKEWTAIQSSSCYGLSLDYPSVRFRFKEFELAIFRA